MASNRYLKILPGKHFTNSTITGTEGRYSSQDVSYICLMTATERGSCELPTSHLQCNSSPGVGFSHMALYTWKPWTTEDIEKLNIIVCFLMFCARDYTCIPIFCTTEIWFQHNYYLRHFPIPAFRQSSLNLDSPKFNNTKISSFTVKKQTTFWYKSVYNCNYITLEKMIITCAATSGFGPNSNSLLANDAPVLKFFNYRNRNIKPCAYI